MKKIRMFLTILLSISAVMLSRCSSEKVSNGAISSNSNVIEVYNDSKAIKFDDNTSVKLNSTSTYGYGSSNFSFDSYVIVKNLLTSTQTYNVSEMRLIKENTDAVYTVSSSTLMFSNSFTLEAELEKQINFSSTIPSRITDDNYKLCFKLNKKEIVIHLYETPDSLRTDRTISYYINNKLVNSSVVKDGKKPSELYTYESEDHLTYCNSWKTKNYESLTTSTIVTADISVYGIPVSNIKFSTTSSDKYTFVNGVNYIPSDKILIIPHTNGGKEICISNYAINGLNVKSIYIPNTTHTIYSGNFTNISNANIYYEGTKTEWESLFFSKSDIVTTNVYFNTKAPSF